MKIMLILALLAVAATGAIAQLDTTFGHGYYEEQPQWQLQMKPCREFLRQQCSPAAPLSIRPEASSCQAVRRQCCRQLAQIPVHSRCQAMCDLQQAIAQQQQQWRGLYRQPQVETMTMAVQTLPAMCGVYVPSYCAAVMAATCSSTGAWY